MADLPVDLRGVYRLIISHESGSPCAEWVADHLAQTLRGSAYLRIRRLPTHEPVTPHKHGDASIHISASIRYEQNNFSNRRNNSLMCGPGEIDCGRQFSPSPYELGTLWGTLHVVVLRAGFPPQERTIVDHIDRGPRQDLYERLAARTERLF